MRVRAPERNRVVPGSATILAAALLLAAGCGRGVPPATTTALDDDAITVASFNFPESVLVGEDLRAGPRG